MKYRNDLKKRVLAGLFAGAALCLAAPAALAANSPIPNNTLPSGGSFVAGGIDKNIIPNQAANRVDITQTDVNAVIKWESFNVGANATVNFNKEGGGQFNTLNYVTDKGGMSQIYGNINAENGNIYIVNPAGVEIGNSAQINVGSLYVSNRNLDDFIKENMTAPEDMAAFIQQGTTTDAVLMSLGNINAGSVTFDGGRIVIDTERLKEVNGDAKLTKDKITVHTNNAANVVIGYDAYNEGDNKGTYEGKQVAASSLATIDEKGQEVTNLNAYMWVEDVEQLQKIDTNLGGNYALRNSIDATATQEWNNGEGFKPIGIDSTGKVIVENSKYGFHGNFDGLSYNIFNLNINRTDAVNVGLFGVLHEAEINNVTFVGGAITGGNVVGSLAGAVLGNTHVNNVMNSASVTGGADVGGIIGYSGDNVDGSSAEQTGTSGSTFTGLINTGTVTGKKQEHIGEDNNVGGLIGYLYNGTLGGTSYNLGSVTGEGHNVGGLVGHALNATLGDGKNLIYNRLNVTGAYNVGGIVGNMESTQVYNAENSGNVSATRYKTGDYFYHSAHYKESNEKDIVKQENVNIANAGGIAGSASGSSMITDVLNTGDVSSSTAEGNSYTYYMAGNVGGIVGSAVDTNITNATNQENEIRGAHNVGGIAGYFSGKGTLEKGVNDGGDILATGARNDSGFVKEWVRGGSTGGEENIIGNMGGIVGYMDGDDVYIMASANRGTVHSQDITEDTVLPVSQAANVGGIVGKIDRDETKNIDAIKGDVTQAAVSNSYSTGDVRGYMGVGGIAGMMYNGEIAGSYNLGTVNTTRNAASFGTGSYYSVNMGGIVGDTTEGTNASALLYDVYNKGQIGDETFTYYARHVGGIVGRLSGTVEKAYNTGAIYNGYNVVGGIVGWMYKGSVTNAFNTGNITVYNQEENNTAGIQAGGIAGGAQTGVTISNVYNLGTIRGFQDEPTLSESGNYAVGGIVGAFIYGGSQTISNAYTTGNLYLNVDGESIISGLGGIYGFSEGYRPAMTLTNTYYIRPDKNLGNVFTDLSAIKQDNSNKAIDFDKKDNMVDGKYENQYWYEENNIEYSFGFSSQNGGGVVIEAGEDWRIYEGSTPILNAFLPNAEDYFSGNKVTSTGDKITPNLDGIDTIQYGTAYDPLLTIIKANGDKADLKFNWQELGINNDAGLAVYGAGLTLNDFMATGGSGYFGGLIYSDGALTIKADTAGGNPHSITGDVALGSASQLYGSSVAINADGQVTIYGSVTATGNVQDGTSWSKDEHKYTGKIAPTDGSVSISGGSVDIYGQLTSADGQPVKVPGINGMAAGWSPETDGTSVSDPKDAMSDIGDRFGYTTSGSAVDGNITIIANDASDGHVNVYYGNQKEGFIDAAGSLYVEAKGDIYMDSDLKVGGDLTLTSPGEMVLDLTNIGQVQADKGLVTDALTGLHDFMHQFETGGNTISFQTGTSDGTAADAKLAVDMWNDEKNAYDLGKYDTNDHTFKGELDKLNFTVQGDKTASAAKYTYIWVSTGEQLKGIQEAAKTNSDFLGYNFALKNDIDVSGVTDYEAIGTGSADGYTGTFDGRDNRIIGLDTTKKADGTTQTLTNAGIFDTIGAGGKVEYLRVYAGTFSGTDNAGAVAGVNNGTISNVTAFGNVVDVQNTSNGASYAGGIAGTNRGTIDNVTVTGTATQSSEVTAGSAEAAAGGIAGLNDSKISNSTANSAVNSSAGDATALGGVAGVNAGTLTNVDSLGVTTGVYKVEGKDTLYSDNVGGIAGTNSGTVENAYNESIVSGRDNVGGILGENSGKNVSNVANASNVTGEAGNGAASNFVGGLVGDNKGSITNGRNNGEITGNRYVGGLVGENGKDSTLSNLVNDEAASITGDEYVGGIAGRNYGTISANDEQLVNRGSITGQMYVGGVAGSNEAGGTITNTISSIALHVKTDAKDVAEGGDLPQYFGGVVGQNSGIIKGATNESSVDVAADGASMVGGIIGENTETGKLEGTIANKGVVSGKSDVGGIIGSNKNDDILNNSAGADRLIVSNSGRVQAEDGGAAGIFYNNTGAINNADLTNTGMVIGGSSKDSVTGGLFGKNSGKISNSTLTNNGTVYGGGTVGGLIGENKGKISHSSLINSTDGEVIGIQNVGGLIGVNSGDITGGRTDAEGNDVGYYKYQIYNNGTITVEGNGTNIGGLIGTNEAGATVTAGYNTGVIHADGSSNVGGIAGTNEGTLDQVFNTVMDADGTAGNITGSTNVGGIAGTNTKNGTISNAYNTTAIAGTVSGAIAGANSGAISNVYGSEKGTLVDSGKLVGSGSDTVSNVYDSENDTFGDGGSAIDKKGGASASTTPWRQYGDNNPILKVFLTTVTYDETKNDQNLVYNGKDQTLDIDGLITSGAFDAADDFTAHKNVEGGLIFNDNDSNIDAGRYTDDLWSVQIGAGKDSSPNNLGYDVQSVEYDIGKATIDISLDDIYRLYGNGDMYKDANRTHGSNAYKNYWRISVGNDEDFDQSVLQGILDNIVKNAEITDDGKGTAGRQTANAGDHNWQVNVDISDISKNFQLKDQGSATSHTYVGADQSHVAKAQLTVDLGEVDRTYGNTAITGGGYTANITGGLVNGDDALGYDGDDLAVTVTGDGALTGSSTGRVTNDAGDYTWSGTVTGKDGDLTNLSDNYEIVINGNGVSKVHRKEITIGADSHEIYVGESEPPYTGTDIQGQLVNGDIISDGSYQYGTEQLPADTSKPGEFDIGIHFGSTYLDGDSDDSAWDGVLNSLFKNYNVTFKPGTLTVVEWPADVVEPPVDEHWNFLFHDNPWDRNCDFRERKAEVHFVAGGMTL